MIKAIYFIAGIIILGIGFSVGFIGKDFYGKEKSAGLENNQSMPVSTGPTSSCPSIDWTNSPFAGKNYFQKFTLKGKIASIDNSEIQLSIGNIDVSGSADLGLNDSGERKISITDQTEIAAQPENIMGNPVPVGGTNSAPLDSDKKDLKSITAKDLVKDDIIFIMTLEDVRETNDLTAVKIVKEHKNIMAPAPMTP